MDAGKEESERRNQGKDRVRIGGKVGGRGGDTVTLWCLSIEV